MYNLLRGLALSFLLIFLSLIFFPGCSSTYVQEQYPSKKEFYRKINSECSNRTVNLNFAADSSVSSNITVVSVDSIHWKSFTTDTSFRIIPLTNIKDISYSKVRLKNFDGVLTLKDDSLLHVVNSVYRKNDISTAVTTTIKHGYSAPINEIKSISFNNHIKGMFQYAFIGMLGGGIAGYFADRFQQGGEVSGAMNGSLLCGIGGAVLGLIVGSPQKYLLNVDHLHAGIIHRFGLVGGMTFSMLVGGFSDGRSFGTTELDHFACGLFYRQPLTEMFRLRLELLYETKGGNYDYSGEYLPSSYYLKEETATVKLTEVEVPCLLEIGKRSYSSLSFQGLIGPALNYYLHGQLEEYQVGYHNNNIKLRQVPVKAHPYLSILMGCDIQWNTNFATEFLWDQELTSSGNIRMINGGELNLKQNDLLIRVAYTL